MKEEKIDLWTVPFLTNFRCITTNGTVKQNGELVMGRGCTKEAANIFPWLPKKLGNLIKKEGNRVHFFHLYNLLTFPVKHNWWEKADINLILKSAYELVDFTEWLKEQNSSFFKKINNIYLPKPGCGNGGLNWLIEVKPIIEPVLNMSLIPVIIVYI